MKDKENAMKFIKELKRKTRKRYNSEEKIAVVLAGFKHEESIAQICRNHGITPATYYKWSKDFMEAGKHRLQGDTLREANTSEVKKLQYSVVDNTVAHYCPIHTNHTENQIQYHVPT